MKTSHRNVRNLRLQRQRERDICLGAPPTRQHPKPIHRPRKEKSL